MKAILISSSNMSSLLGCGSKSAISAYFTLSGKPLSAGVVKRMIFFGTFRLSMMAGNG